MESSRRQAAVRGRSSGLAPTLSWRGTTSLAPAIPMQLASKLPPMMRTAPAIDTDESCCPEAKSTCDAHLGGRASAVAPARGTHRRHEPVVNAAAAAAARIPGIRRRLHLQAPSLISASESTAFKDDSTASDGQMTHPRSPPPRRRTVMSSHWLRHCTEASQFAPIIFQGAARGAAV